MAKVTRRPEGTTPHPWFGGGKGVLIPSGPMPKRSSRKPAEAQGPAEPAGSSPNGNATETEERTESPSEGR